jgi:hypothetical protein
MFLRSFLISRNIQLKFLTIDASSISFLDHSDGGLLLGIPPQDGRQLELADPANRQSAEQTIRDFTNAAIEATRKD